MYTVVVTPVRQNRPRHTAKRLYWTDFIKAEQAQVGEFIHVSECTYARVRAYVCSLIGGVCQQKLTVKSPEHVLTCVLGLLRSLRCAVLCCAVRR